MRAGTIYPKVLRVFDTETSAELTERKGGVGVELMPSFIQFELIKTLYIDFFLFVNIKILLTNYSE